MMTERAKVFLEEMLVSVSDEYDKRPGSYVYDVLAAAAMKIAETQDATDAVARKLDIENLSGEELEKYIHERTGISRRQATRSTGAVMVTGTGTINAGDLFESSAGVQFRATETKSITGSGTVKIEAVIAGSSGVVPAGTITLFPVTLTGFTSVTNPAPTQDGFEQEPDDDLLQRYYERLRTPATSGNKSHYLNWAKEVPGVGDARVVPLWNGPNT